LRREEAARQGRGEESCATALRGGPGSGPIASEKAVGAAMRERLPTDTWPAQYVHCFHVHPMSVLNDKFWPYPHGLLLESGGQ
jgi:hypothetical protein